MVRKIFIFVVAILPFMATAADIAAGESAYNTKCIACHGAQGLAPIMPIYPKLGGQNAAYLIKQIKDFQSGSRQDATMNAMSKLIDDVENENVAAYLEMQSSVSVEQ